MKELLQAGVPVPVAAKAARQAGNFSDDDAQHIIARQQAALILMTMILDDVRRSIPQLGESLDRIIQQAIDNAGTGQDLAERLERETWMGIDLAAGQDETINTELVRECQYRSEGHSFPCNPMCEETGWCYTRVVDAKEKNDE